MLFVCVCVCVCVGGGGRGGGFIKLCSTLRRSHSLFLGSFPLPCTEGIGKSPGTRIVTPLVDGIHDMIEWGWVVGETHQSQPSFSPSLPSSPPPSASEQLSIAWSSLPPCNTTLGSYSV